MSKLAPLQTHGQYEEHWLPPNGGRFITYTRSDEKWMRPLGLGTIRKQLLPLYDVRLPDESLVGYIEHDPSLWDGRSFMMNVMDSFPRTMLDPEPKSGAIQRLPYRTVTLDCARYRIGQRQFIVWTIHSPSDALLLIRHGIIKYFGRDRLVEIVDRLRMAEMNRRYLGFINYGPPPNRPFGTALADSVPIPGTDPPERSVMVEIPTVKGVTS